LYALLIAAEQKMSAGKIKPQQKGGRFYDAFQRLELMEGQAVCLYMVYDCI